MASNIFLSLAKYADRQTENFLTESFVYLLNVLLEQEPSLAQHMIQNLCGDKCKSWFSLSKNIVVTSQITIDTGRPDILIELDKTKVIFIEVKHDSHLGWAQLERYMSHLNNGHYEEKQLVLLTRSRHSIQETTLPQSEFHHVCWYEISGWLSEERFADPVAKHLVNQFLEFLRQKEMTMEKVNWEYMEGVPAMINLANMLYTAIAEALPEEKWRRTAGWNWIGYYIGSNPPVFTGIRYHNPLIITFENNGGTNPSFTRDLPLPQVHFFSLTAGEQLECLIKFTQESYSEYMKEKSNLEEQIPENEDLNKLSPE
jgi:hypothetical protein